MPIPKNHPVNDSTENDSNEWVIEKSPTPPNPLKRFSKQWTKGWQEAKRSDRAFISGIAEKNLNPDDDLSETMIAWFHVRQHVDLMLNPVNITEITDEKSKKSVLAVPNRLRFLEENFGALHATGG